MEWNAERYAETRKLILKAANKFVEDKDNLPADTPEMEDVVSEGFLALSEREKKNPWNPEKGAWSTYVFDTIRKKIWKLYRDGSRDKRKIVHEEMVQDDNLFYSITKDEEDSNGGVL